ncbi:glycosyltransferase [Algoriphagus aestuariicola]|uniref:Glycosyltransferase n=1 Tax=Algoriphagus aestuariicola TaxID=1852016 RepID=A0ABS3BPA2_9BACT|nr:glycosyltransferase [Algoriphagus aestuariicola]MBN7801122.1 glycosyltransferase [Algoriphagus aestuariicola]
MKRIVFIAKTNLNNDGRILNQIKFLQNHFKEKLDLHFLLLPDRPYFENLGTGVKIHDLNTSFRNSRFLRIFTVLEFTQKAIRRIIQLKPSVIHVQDMTVVLPVYLYKKCFGNRVTVIYDDHEMPNENESLQYRLFQFFERRLMQVADFVIYANQERREILDKELGIANSSYFLNLPYYDDQRIEVDEKIDPIFQSKLDQLIKLKKDGVNIIVHQGLLEVERGREKLANFSKLDFPKTKIVVIGITELDFNLFIQQYNLDYSNFYFVGSVPYKILREFWKLADAAIIMYLPTYINNRLCAPNRYFIALELGIPTIVNIDNPVLSSFTEKYKSGFYIEDIVVKKDIDRVISHSYSIDTLNKLKEKELIKFGAIYEKFI